MEVAHDIFQDILNCIHYRFLKYTLISSLIFKFLTWILFKCAFLRVSLRIKDTHEIHQGRKQVLKIQKLSS